MREYVAQPVRRIADNLLRPILTRVDEALLLHRDELATLNPSSGVLSVDSLQLNGFVSGVLTLKAANITTSHTLTFPAAQGAAGSVLQDDGAGALSWSVDVPLATLADPARGDLMVGDSTPAWSSLAVGSAGDVLTTDGTDPSWSGNFADKTADETISGDYDFTGRPQFDGGSGGYMAIFDTDAASGNMPVFRTSSTYSWYFGLLEDADNIGLNIMPLALDGAPNSGYTALIFPGAGGTVLTTNATQTISHKNLLTANTLTCGGSYTKLIDYTDTSRTGYFDLSNLTSSRNYAWGMLDFTGNVHLGLPGVDNKGTATVSSTALVANTAISDRLMKIDAYAECTNDNGKTDSYLELQIDWTSNGHSHSETAVFQNYDKGGAKLDTTTIGNIVKADFTIFVDASSTVYYTATVSGTDTGGEYRLILVPTAF